VAEGGRGSGVTREKVWVVRPGDGTTLAAIVARAGELARAITDGRVFVGKRRITRPEHPVKPGDVVRIGAPPHEPRRRVVLFVEGDLVVCNKPAGLPTVPDHAGASHCLVALAARETGARDLRVTSRLDRDVSGVVVLAATAAGEARLRRARAEGRYQRRYLALGVGDLPAEVTWDAPIGRARDPRLRAAFGPDAKPSLTHARVVARTAGVLLLAVEPITGRTHQIRVHASAAGAPLVGDRDYGGPRSFTSEDGRVVALDRIALHAARVSVDGVRADAPVPDALAAVWSALGGHAEAWDEALAMPAHP